MWKIGSALAAGNAVILKPSELITLLIVLCLWPLFIEAGFPDSVTNIVNGSGSTVSQALNEHISRNITFAGSAPGLQRHI
ncbi:aldehyde dehydrogenase domain-containing protein [Suillus spraguei]|nr:aldehyde dehydrogenase domain-containing protein [Suillus spraguei]